MRISDWSSDVCSSDLGQELFVDLRQAIEGGVGVHDGVAGTINVGGQAHSLRHLLSDTDGDVVGGLIVAEIDDGSQNRPGVTEIIVEVEIGRASCRERGCQYV